MKSIIFSLAILMSSVVLAEITDDLQESSVMIKAGDHGGSGVIFQRDGETFAWTAAHVVGSLRSTRKIIKDGNEEAVVEFTDPHVVQILQQNGREVGELKLSAKVLKYSDADHGEDLALLHIRKSGHFQKGVTFHLGEEIPKIGSDLYHVGSLLGQVGSNSLTTGIISQHGRLIGDKVYDQSTATSFPGSSGGGVFLRSDGRYVGMVVRAAGEGFNLIVPVRRMWKWCQDEKIEWAMDPRVKMPAVDEIYDLPVE